MFSFPIYSIGVLLSLNFYLASAAITSYENVLDVEDIYTKEYYFKVPQSLPTSVKEDTFLSSTSYPKTRVSLKFICLSKCTAEPNCALACLNETTCTTYFALIADYWTPSTSDNLETFTETCYSNWKFLNDITSQITATTSSLHYDGLHPENAINGIYTVVNTYAFHSSPPQSPWIEFDLGDVVKISKIIVKTRHGSADLTYFQNVEVAISTPSSNAVVDYCCMTMAPIGSMIIFTGEEPWFARYVMLRNINSSPHLIIGDIKIIG